MIKLSGITWITTYNCNIACEHCFFDTQAEKRYMDPELVNQALGSLPEQKHMFWQHLSGGEIFIQQEKLFQIIANIRKHFSKNIGLSTNGFWAKEEQQTRETVQELKRMGVTGIAISADHYHQQHMPLDGPQTLARIIKEEGIKTHSYIMGARLPEDVEGAKEVNDSSESIAAQVDQGLGIPLARATERSIGKGSLINIPKKKAIPQGMCTELCTCLGERTPFNPAMVWIDPYGNVMICYGLCIGNLYQDSLADIITQYDARQNPISQALAQDGPKALFKMAKEVGKKVSKKFYDECDICYQMRCLLKEDYKEVLKPDECYPV